jgi:hypothetical protein
MHPEPKVFLFPYLYMGRTRRFASIKQEKSDKKREKTAIMRQKE